MPWRREWLPASLPGKSHGQRSLADYSPWGHKELDTTNTFKYTIPNTAQMRLMAVYEPHIFTVWGRRTLHITRGHPGFALGCRVNKQELQEAGFVVTRGRGVPFWFDAKIQS